jgi:hypothetical protein
MIRSSLREKPILVLLLVLVWNMLVVIFFTSAEYACTRHYFCGIEFASFVLSTSYSISIQSVFVEPCHLKIHKNHMRMRARNDWRS